MKPDKVTVLLAVALGAFGSTVHRDVARQEPVRAGPPGKRKQRSKQKAAKKARRVNRRK
jgi:hypothetical protein